MLLDSRICVSVLGTFLSHFFLHTECKMLAGYMFPVYSTEFCPRNGTEWNKRSSALNCTERNGYTCLPNQNFTQLLEFCYTEPRILIEEGLCLYLVNHISKVNGYKCFRFEYGCPKTSYLSTDIFNYPSCIAVQNGCFLAESSCKRRTTPNHTLETTENRSHIQETTESQDVIIKNIKDMDLSKILIAVIIPTSVFGILLLYMYYIYRKHIRVPIRNRNSEIESPREATPLMQETSPNKNYSPREESLFEKAFFDQWQQDDNYFIPTKACKEVENKTQTKNLVIVTGHSGSGKSAIIQHIALIYRKQGWVVKPLIYVRDFQDAYSSGETLKGKTLFVLNDPFGKETFNETLYTSWSKIEEALKSCLKRVKLLMSCRKYVLSDDRVKGLFSDTPYIVDISNDRCKLTEDEKRLILNSHTSNLNLSEEDCAEIVKIDTYFPLLCKLYATKKTYQNEKVRFFQEPVSVFQEEIRYFKVRDKEKYCALVLLVFFNNDFDVDFQLEPSFEEKYETALKLCGMDKTTPRSSIRESLESLKGFFVKKIGDNYQFYHDFVMEVTALVFGTDYPTEIIRHADIGFLRRRVRLSDGYDPDNSFFICIGDKNTDELGRRLFAELFGERLLDVVLNSCLENEKIIEVFKKQIILNPEQLIMFLEIKPLHIKKHDIIVSKNFTLSKLDFLGLKSEISPLFALIVYGHTNLSMYCLEILQRMKTNLTDSYLFSAVCCSGSLDLFHKCFTNDTKHLLNEKWSFLNPIHTLSAYHHHEMLVEVSEFIVNINLKTDINDDGEGWTPLILAAGNNTEEHSSEMRRNKTIQLLLSKGADINLCNNLGVSPLYAAALNGYDSTVELLLENGAEINLTEDFGESPLYAASKYGHDSTVQILINNGADVNLCNDFGECPFDTAIHNRYAGTVKILLENSVNVDLCSFDEDTSSL